MVNHLKFENLNIFLINISKIPVVLQLWLIETVQCIADQLIPGAGTMLLVHPVLWKTKRMHRLWPDRRVS
jgi:hypothetical protein